MTFDKNQIIAVALGAIVIAAGSFYAGTKLPRGGMMRGGFPQGGMQGAGARNNLNRGAMTVGTVIAKDAGSITVQLGNPASTTTPQDTGSRIIFYSSSTQVGKFSVGSEADVVVGSPVMVTGTPNADGSITAQMIQIRPEGMPAFGTGRGPGMNR